MILCYGTLFPMHDVIVCILLAIYNSDVLHVESAMLGLKPLGGIKMLCEVFRTWEPSEDFFACVKHWKGVLFACVKQW